MNNIKTNTLVLGSGPGGHSAAFKLSNSNNKVIMVERYKNLGGTCLNAGCIPSKSLLHIASIIKEVEYYSTKVINDKVNMKVNFKKIHRWKDEIIKNTSLSISNIAKKKNIQIIRGNGKFVSKNKLLVTSNNNENICLIQFDNAVIATGSYANKAPLFSDKDHCITSTKALNLQEIPKDLLIIGGGSIGLEMASIYNTFGSNVSIIEEKTQLLPEIDSDMSNYLKKNLGLKEKNIILGSSIIDIKKENNHLLSRYLINNKLNIIKSNKIIFAGGRRPNTDLIGLESIGINVNPNGFIEVDNQMQTNIKNIFAIGDVSGVPMLAHKAIAESDTVSNVIFGKDHYFNPKCIPSVTYSFPEVSYTGLTEKKATDKNINYNKTIYNWKFNSKNISMGQSLGLTKILYDKIDNKVLGGCIIGKGSDSLISEISLAIEMNCCIDDLALTIHPHPTLSETIQQSAEVDYLFD